MVIVIVKKRFIIPTKTNSLSGFENINQRERAKPKRKYSVIKIPLIIGYSFKYSGTRFNSSGVSKCINRLTLRFNSGNNDILRINLEPILSYP